jgi:hypothetical protein
MTNTHRTRMLKLLTVALFMCYMIHWKMYWGEGSAISDQLLYGGIYSTGNVALLWGVLLFLGKRRKLASSRRKV